MKKWLDNSTFIDNHGYLRDKHNRLIHRQIAFQQIFRPNRNKYSRPFSDYNVHHIDQVYLMLKQERKQLLRKTVPGTFL